MKFDGAELRIFMGSNGERADSKELLELGGRAVSEGYQLFLDTANVVAKYDSVPLEGKTVRLAGGWANACVAGTADYCLEKGADEVRINLLWVRIWWADGDSSSEEKEADIRPWVRSEGSGRLTFIR